MPKADEPEFVQEVKLLIGDLLKEREKAERRYKKLWQDLARMERRLAAYRLTLVTYRAWKRGDERWMLVVPKGATAQPGAGQDSAE